MPPSTRLNRKVWSSWLCCASVAKIENQEASPQPWTQHDRAPLNRFNRAQQLALLISTDFYWSFTPDTTISVCILVCHMNITKGPQSSPTAPRSGAVAWNGVCATCSCWMIWGNGRKNYKETAWPMAQWPNGPMAKRTHALTEFLCQCKRITLP